LRFVHASREAESENSNQVKQDSRGEIPPVVKSHSRFSSFVVSAADSLIIIACNTGFKQISTGVYGYVSFDIFVVSFFQQLAGSIA